jgi:hypothetical protein
MSQTFSIKIDPDDLRRVQSMLADIKGAAPRVATRAINKTMTGTKTDTSTAIRAEITAKKSAVDKTIKITRATDNNPTAYIASTGKPLPLMDYGARQTNKGVSVQVRKDRTRKVVPQTFIETMKTGHKGVFWRKWHQNKAARMSKTEAAINRSGYVWSAKRNRYIAISSLPREYRLPMEERYGPRVPDIMSNEPVMKSILDKAGERLHGNLEHETDYELSKHKQ